MNEPIAVWTVLQVVLIPVAGVGWWLLWGRGSEQWQAIDALRKEISDHQRDCLTRFATVDSVSDVKKDLDGRLDRIEGKLDRALARAS